MKVCNDNHEEIVFDDSSYRARCPVCEVMEEKDQVETDRDTAQEQASELQGKINDADRMLRRCNSDDTTPNLLGYIDEAMRTLS